MLKGVHIIFLFIVLSASVAKAQEEDSVRSKYVKEFPNEFNVKMFASNRLLILNLVDRNGGNRKINYAPNDRGYIGVGTYIFDIGLELAFKMPLAFSRSKSRYGDTDFIDFQGSLYGKKWSADATFQKYDGFYVSNAPDIYPDFDVEKNYPQRSDLSVMNISINGIHIFNHEKFSFRSGFIQADKQIKSAGSPIMILSATRYSVNADSLLLPFAAIDRNFIDGRFVSISLLGGYAYDFVLDNFFIKLNANGGTGIQHQKFDMGMGDKQRWDMVPKLNFRAALGYDNERFFAGASFMMQRTSINFDGIRINNTTGNYKIFVGYRFEKFGILKKYSIKDILPKSLSGL